MPRELTGQSPSRTASTRESLGLQRKRSRAALTCTLSIVFSNYFSHTECRSCGLVPDKCSSIGRVFRNVRPRARAAADSYHLATFKFS